MNQNMGAADRLIRMSVGALLVAGSVFGWWGVWGLLGLVPVFTGFLGTCPLYAMLGIHTRRGKAQGKGRPG